MARAVLRGPFHQSRIPGPESQLRRATRRSKVQRAGRAHRHLATPALGEHMTAHACDRRSFLASGIGVAVGMSLAPALAASNRGELTGLTLSEASELLGSRAVSAVELTQACLDRIEKYNPV